QENLLPGADLLSDPAQALDGDGRDMDPTDPGGDRPDGSSSWHGTHVTGTIGANTHNGIGVAGVAWSTWLVPVRVLGKGGGIWSDSIAGVAWGAGYEVDGVSRNQNIPHVLNMSLGGPGTPIAAVQDLLDVLANNRIIVVAAAGNESSDASDF